jgi:hypothetical protein
VVQKILELSTDEHERDWICSVVRSQDAALRSLTFGRRILDKVALFS